MSFSSLEMKINNNTEADIPNNRGCSCIPDSSVSCSSLSIEKDHLKSIPVEYFVTVWWLLKPF